MCEKGSTYGLVWVGDPWRVCLGCTMTFVELLQPLFTATVTSRRDHPEMISRLWLDTVYRLISSRRVTSRCLKTFVTPFFRPPWRSSSLQAPA